MNDVKDANCKFPAIRKKMKNIIKSGVNITNIPALSASDKFATPVVTIISICPKIKRITVYLANSFISVKYLSESLISLFWLLTIFIFLFWTKLLCELVLF